MPSAARGFTPELVVELVAAGIEIAPIVLHTGVSSPETGEPPFPEWFRVPEATARHVNAVRAGGGRVVAVGTTSLRALESQALASSSVAPGAPLAPGSGETNLFITPGFAFRVVDLMLTNFHLPKSTLMMLVSAFAGHARVMALYRHAIAARYRFFSYGDAMLLRRVAASAAVG